MFLIFSRGGVLIVFPFIPLYIIPFTVSILVRFKDIDSQSSFMVSSPSPSTTKSAPEFRKLPA